MVAFGSLALAAPPAGADQTVVSATIYPGAQGSVSTKAAPLSVLQTCEPYSGPNPIYLYPGQQPFQAPPDSTWTVSELLQCALGIPSREVSDVQVGTVSRGFEAPLSSAALTDPGQYQDPAAPGALPIISSDGAEDQNTYVRPYRGGADRNAFDQVVQTEQPIALLVYLNGSLLSVTATQQTLSHTATARSIRLAATVRNASGAAVPASALSWNWSFGDGTSSTGASPTHTFRAGAYVTVSVTDTATGSGGTATLQVNVGTGASTGPANHNGNPKPTKSKNPSGSDHGSPTPTGSGHHEPKSTSHGGNQTTTTPTTSTTQTTPTTPATDTTPAETTTSPTTSTSTTTTSSTTTRRAPPATHTHPRTQPPVPPNAPLVTGELISDVTPLPPSSSPLVHLVPAAVTPAPGVRQASRISAAPALGGALAVGLLLALGAGRELRGRRRCRLSDHGN